MKRILTTLLTGAISTFTMAATWQEQQLPVQRAEPAPMGEPVQYQAPKKSYSSSASSAFGDYVSFNAAFSGSRIGAENVGGDSTFSGIDLGIMGGQENLSAGLGFTYQADSDWKYSEVYSKFGYRLFSQNNNYGIVSTGVGYAWLSAKDYAIDLDYFVLPVELEVGHYFQPKLAAYAALGYKWLWNTSGEVCYSNICGSGSSSELDVDGMTYKAGLRYNF